MLQMMQKKVEDEGKKEEELYDKFMCYCKTGVGQLVQSIKTGEAKVVQLESSIEETDAVVKQLVSDTKKAKDDKAEAEGTIAKAGSIRNKEGAAFAKSSADSTANVASLGKALQALKKGMVGSFLQTEAASAVRRLSISMDISDAARDVLTNFLSNSQDSEEYATSTPEIIGIIDQMLKTMKEELADAKAKEAQAVKDFDALKAAKEKQVSTLTKEIETKMIRSGDSGVQLTTQKADLSDTSKGLVTDKKFLIDLTLNCKTKQREKEGNDKMRADELLALADTIKLLNDDDALDLFKKTLPKPSFMQLQVSSDDLKQQALHVLTKKHRHGKRDFRLNLIALVLRGKKANFEKVVKMIEDMMALLKKEQETDTNKKAYCAKHLDETEDDFKDLQADIKDLEKALAENKEAIKAVAADLSALTKGISDLDQQVKDATKQRKEENAEYQETMSSNAASKELLNMAKNRLAKFYAPKLYKGSFAQLDEAATLDETADTSIKAAAAQYESDAEDEDEPFGFLQVKAGSRHRRLRNGRAQAAPPTAGAYKKSDGNAGVMQMISTLMNELQTEMTKMEANEKESQKEYEAFMKDSADKRAEDSKAIADKEGSKVELEATTLKMAQGKKGKVAESMAMLETMQGLHGECDWLIKNFDKRKEARASEVENLNNAKAVLSGADYSFLQIAKIHQFF
jgi:hypothetical protein